MIDSTGLTVFGAGEWLQEKHGVRTRRTWRKLHLAVDAQTGMVIASTMTANDMGDSSQVAALLDQVDAGIGSVTADGAYDGAPTYDELAAHAGDIPVIIPPHVTAVPGAAVADHHPSQRDRHIAVMAAKGRLGWQEETSYGRRSLVETAMGRYKTIIGPGLRAQPARPTHGGGHRCGGTQSHVARRTAKLRPQSKNGFLRLMGKGNLRPYRHPCNNAVWPA